MREFVGQVVVSRYMAVSVEDLRLGRAADAWGPRGNAFLRTALTRALDEGFLTAVANDSPEARRRRLGPLAAEGADDHGPYVFGAPPSGGSGGGSLAVRGVVRPFGIVHPQGAGATTAARSSSWPPHRYPMR